VSQIAYRRNGTVRMTTSEQYSANNLSQYTSRDVPGYVDLNGAER